MIIIGVVVLWLSFIAVTRIVNNTDRSKLNPFQKLAVILFVALDVFDNYTIFTVIFWELPSNDRKTVTARLKHILHTEDYRNTWRFKLAVFMCKYMIEPFDWGHCALGRVPE